MKYRIAEVATGQFRIERKKPGAIFWDWSPPYKLHATVAEATEVVKRWRDSEARAEADYTRRKLEQSVIRVVGEV